MTSSQHAEALEPALADRARPVSFPSGNDAPGAGAAIPAGSGGSPPVRVLHVVGHLLRGGVEAWLHNVVRRLGPDRYRHDVLVWTEDEEAFTSEFREAGARVIPCTGHKNPLRFARNFRAVLRRNGPYDILHTHGTQHHGFVMGLARMAGIPTLVAHSHTDIQPILAGASRPYRAYAALGHAALRGLATAGFGVSEIAARSLFGEGWKRDPRWSLLYCGIDLAPFEATPDPGLRRHLGIPDGRLVLGHVGRFHHQKNQDFILDVLHEARKLRPDVQALLIGDGPDRLAVTARAAAMGLAPHLTVVPDCRTVPLHLLSAMDRFLFPSRYEGLALATVEAQAARLSCLISDAVSEEVVVDESLARRMPLGAGPAAWAAAILAMPDAALNRAARPGTSLRGGMFDVDHSARALDHAYRTLLARRTGLSRQESAR